MTEQKTVTFDTSIATEGKPGKTNDQDTKTKDQGDTPSEKKKNPWTRKNNKDDPGKPPSGKPKGFQGGTEGLEGKIFYYGKDMATKCMLSREAFLLYAGTTYTASEKMSLKKGRIIVIGIPKPKEDYTQKELDALTPYQRKNWDLSLKRYNEADAKVRTNLTSLYSVLWSQMTTSLQNKVKTDAEFEDIEDTQDCIRLLNLVELTCSSPSVITHFPTRMCDHAFNIMTLSGNKMSLAHYYKQFQERVKVGRMAGVNFATPDLRTFLQTRFKHENPGDTDNKEYEEFNKSIGDHANSQFLALVFMRQCGDRFAQVRREIQNDYVKGTDHIPRTLEQAYAVFESYEMEKAKGGKSTKGDHQVDNTNPNTKGKYPGHTFQQKSFL